MSRLIGLGIACSLACLAAQDSAPAPGEPRATIVDGQVVVEWPGEPPSRKPRESHYRLYLPDPISVEEIARYCARLRLSEPQQRFLEEVYARYLTDEEKFNATVVADLWDQSLSIERSGALGDDVELGERWRRMIVDGRGRVLSGLKSLDRGLFDQFDTCLSEDQLSRARGIRMERDRSRFSFSEVYPGGAFDVSIAILQLENNGYDLGRCEQDRNAILDTYERTVTPLFVERAEVKSAILATWFVARAKARSLAERGDRVGARAAAEEIYSLNEAQCALEKRIARANRRVLDDLAATLPELTKVELEQRFRRHAFPVVYPDDTDLADLFSQVMADNDWTAQQRAELDVIRLWYTVQLDSIQAQMTREYSAWCEHVATKSGYSHSALAEYTRTMTEFDGARLALARSACEQLQSFLRAEGLEGEEVVALRMASLDDRQFTPRR